MGTFNRLHLIRQVDLLTLRIFLSAVEDKQIGLAAARENVAASTATKRIHDLERITGIELLERGPKGVVPTPAGEVLARHVRSIFGSLDEIRSEISDFVDGVRGDVTIASAGSILAACLAEEIGEFSRQHPQVRLRIQEVQNDQVVRQVARGDADIGIYAASRALDLGNLQVTPWRSDRIVAVLPPQHPLAARTRVSMRDLLAENLVVLDALLPAFDEAARRLGDSFEPAFLVRSGTAALSLVEAGLGVTAQPECFVGPEWRERVAVVQIDEPWAERRLQVAVLGGRGMSAAVRALRAQLLERAPLLDGSSEDCVTA